MSYDSGSNYKYPKKDLTDSEKDLLRKGRIERGAKSKEQLGADNKELVSDIIWEAAIGKAIEGEMELLKPSIEHFLSSGKVNGQFLIALKRLMAWTEQKALEVAEEYIKEEAIRFGKFMDASINKATLKDWDWFYQQYKNNCELERIKK